MRINAVFSDFDGTLSPINVRRELARPSAELERVLISLAKLVPFAIVTTKDYNFIASRIWYAHAYACVGGLEIVVPGVGRIYRAGMDEARAQALNDVMFEAKGRGFFVEEKRLSDGTLAGLSVDWRDRPYLEDSVDDVISEALRRGLTVYKSTGPYVDVYAVPIDKGSAVRMLKRFFRVERGVMYLGDSKADEPAFREVDVSVGVIHSENRGLDLNASCLVEFDRVAMFLENLVTNDLDFDWVLCH